MPRSSKGATADARRRREKFEDVEGWTVEVPSDGEPDEEAKAFLDELTTPRPRRRSAER
jgi:hypothetical protein